jgi:membrane protein YdbS with pleckstrin-like domain
VTPRRRRGDDLYGGDLGPLYPEVAPHPNERSTSVPDVVEPDYRPRPPSRLRQAGRRLDEWRQHVLPLPDEVIDQYLGHGERMIHNDHPSLQAFIVQNTLMFLGLFIVAVAVLGISFNGSLTAAGFTFLILGLVLLYLVLKRVRERYTSYVVTNVRIMRISGVFSRRAHSIPWVRVTDLTYEQSIIARLFGYANLHIESANEEGGLRDLEGVSDPVRFNQYIVDMVVAKQGPTAPGWEQQGEPAPIIALPRTRLVDRLRSGRRRRVDLSEATNRGARGGDRGDDRGADEGGDPGVDPGVALPRRRRLPTAPSRTDIGSSTVTSQPVPFDEGGEPPTGAAPDDVEGEDESSGADDLDWNDR